MEVRRGEGKELGVRVSVRVETGMGKPGEERGRFRA